MPLYGCARVSTIGQDLRLQRAELKAAGRDVIGAEKAALLCKQPALWQSDVVPSSDAGDRTCYIAGHGHNAKSDDPGIDARRRDYIRRELDRFFSTLPTVADGFQLKIWRGGPLAGKPKLPLPEMDHSSSPIKGDWIQSQGNRAKKCVTKG